MRRCIVVLAITAVVAPSIARADPTKEQCAAADEGAQDLRASGKLRAARDKLETCLASNCPRVVRDDCAERVREIDAAIPTIVPRAEDGAGRAIVAVRVTIDGEPLADRADGRAFAVDPGDHVLRFEAPGAHVVEQRVTLREREKGRVARVVLDIQAQTPALAPPQSAPPPPPPSTEGSRSTTPAWIAFGIAGAGIVVGSVAGLLGLGAASDAKSHCQSTTCTPDAQDGIDSAKRWATISDVGFVVGALGIGAGSWLLLRGTW